MRIGVIGAGGLGGYFGALLAKNGEEVTFVARGAQLDAFKKKGLTVESPSANFTIPARFTDDIGALEALDLALICVKTYDTREVVRKLAPQLDDDTVIVSFQNGVEKDEILLEAFGRQHVIGGAAYVVSGVVEPGVIRETSGSARLIVGEFDGTLSERAKAIQRVFQDASVKCELSAQIKKVVWEKFIFICGIAGLTTITRLPLGPIIQTEETAKVLVDVMKETESVGRVLSVPLDDDIVSRQLLVMKAQNPNTKSSMLRDLEKGRRLEIESLNGYVARKGRELGISTPSNDLIYACLKPWNQGSGTAINA